MAISCASPARRFRSSVSSERPRPSRMPRKPLRVNMSGCMEELLFFICCLNRLPHMPGGRARGSAFTPSAQHNGWQLSMMVVLPRPFGPGQRHQRCVARQLLEVEPDLVESQSVADAAEAFESQCFNPHRLCPPLLIAHVHARPMLICLACRYVHSVSPAHCVSTERPHGAGSDSGVGAGICTAGTRVCVAECSCEWRSKCASTWPAGMNLRV